MDFGLACEGITDHITIENILCGYFNDIDDLDESIVYLQPAFDETDKQQSNFGGWIALLNYLPLKRFRDDVLNHRYIIIQVDSDISQEKGFDISHYHSDNTEKSVLELIDEIKDKLIQIIESGEAEFYQKYHERILFCITVHSLECWLFCYHNPRKSKTPKIQGCANALERLLNKGNISSMKKIKHFRKNYDCYDALSAPFLKNKNINTTVEYEPSFKVFINELSEINYPVDQIVV